MKTFNLIDYKGKFSIIQDKGKEDDFDIIIGEITKEQALEKSFIDTQKESALYYGVPAYLGNDPELREVFK